MEALLRWATDLGVSDTPPPSSPSAATSLSSSSCLGRSLVVADFPDAGGRGLAAARDLRRGELVLRVPRAAMLTSDRVMADDPRVAACVRAHRSRLSPVQILILCILAEVGKGKSSVWYPYLSQLPSYYTLLCTFNDFEVEALQVDDAIWVAQKAIHAIKSDWEEATQPMKELGFKPKLIMFKSWLWAFATVSSRTLHIAWDDAGCLCPIGDLFNYAAPDDASLEGEDTAEVTNCHQKNEIPCLSERLTDGGYEDDNAYCLFFLVMEYTQTWNFLSTMNSINCRTDVQQSSFEKVFAMFLQFYHVEMDYSDHSQIPARLVQPLERWELAVQWRCNYKKTLTNCPYWDQ
ncbi:hypothetical protein PR202_ga25322 [Eleusine coracana subsp. coracana]|uniref:SET domain-containing protein n=1 Tax=Eleusine coracana subsp. coracana TaxID=191504 RepID=A0AAV5DAQ1_ELECO|nr:hypothetical protein PR202_ga25322 [Eleusine coracana subsp. coracana]